MLKNQLAKGNNGLVKAKYITFGIEADSLKAAKPRMERVEADILANFKTMGVKARPLTGLERLETLHGQLHPDGQEKLRFSWRDIPNTGLSTKDFIAPTSFTFREGKTFGNYPVMDKRYRQKFHIHDYFFAKTLDQVRPGGIVAFVTSRYTMDRRNPQIRKYLA